MSPADASGGVREPERIEAEIERTREQLADTMAAVADRANVKKHAREKVDEVRDRAPGRELGIAFAVTGVVVGSVVIARIVKRRRERTS